VSSTCFDLSQLRADLSDFIMSNGYAPILSEFENFPINPQKNTIDNCINAVKEHADILLLIVGNRYGSLIDNGKSITNFEYLTAKQKGIPVFVFIDKKTLNAFSFWKDNPNGDFSKFVDSTKIFEFIGGIRESSQLWTFEFEKAQDIISILKIQWSYLFKESLKIKAKYERAVSDFFHLNVSNEALKILIDKPDTFELEFFVQTLIDEIKKKENLNHDYKYRIQYDPKSFIHEVKDVPQWVMSRTASISNLITSLTNLFTQALPEFYNNPGEPADIHGLYYISRTYAKIYEHLVNWSIDTRSVHVPDSCVELRDKLSNLAKAVIKDSWEYPFLIEQRLKDAKQAIFNNLLPPKLEMTIKIRISEEDINEYNIEFEKFKATYNSTNHQEIQ